MPDESDSLDLSQLSFRPQWVDSLESKGSPTGGEVIWGRADGRAWSDDSGGFRDRGDRFDRRGPGGRDQRGPRPGGGRPGGPGGARGGPAVGGGFRRPEGLARPDNRGPRPAGPGGAGRPDRGPRPPQGERRGPGGPGGARDDRRGPPRGDRPQRGGERGDRRERFNRDERPQFVAPLAGWEARLLPDPRALDAMARQIRGSGRAYPIFEVARLFLGGRERFLVKLAPRPQGAKPPQPRPGQRPLPEGKGPQTLHRCRADGSLWVTREEALNHILFSPALESYYRKEDVTVEPPKGNFTAIAVCGFSGALLGPPSHHSYQTNVVRLHRERFSDMPLDRFKSRIFVEKEEATVAKWLEQCSKESHWVMVDPGEDGQVERFKTGPEMEAHFLRTYAPSAVEEVNQATVPGTLQARYMSPAIASLVRMEVEQQQRFPMQLVQDLCRDLERGGLRFFKRDKKSTFVCRSRPHYLPEDLALSDRIKAIVEVIRANPGIDYTRLVGVLAPHLRSGEAAPAAAEAEAPAAEAPAEPLGAFTLWTRPYLETAAPAAPEAKEAKAHLAPEELAILQDLRWLMGEGYVTEFNTGELHILGRATQQPGPRRRGVQEYEAEETNAASIAAEAQAAGEAGEGTEPAENQPEAAAGTDAAREWPAGAFTLWTLGL